MVLSKDGGGRDAAAAAEVQHGVSSVELRQELAEPGLVIRPAQRLILGGSVPGVVSVRVRDPVVALTHHVLGIDHDDRWRLVTACSLRIPSARAALL